MKCSCAKIVVFVLLQFHVWMLYSQNTPENLQTALIYKIAHCIKWSKDTTSYFDIGVISDNQLLIEKLKELSRVAKMNRKPIRVVSFPKDNTLRRVHLLYVDENYNQYLFSLIKLTANQNTLLVSVNHKQPGEIMINLRLDPQNNNYTFEYNRANILFAGLDLDEEIVLLKGTEIEIKELYLQAKKLWDEQQGVVAQLKKYADMLAANIANQQDSIDKMKASIEGNQFMISHQLSILAQKDSFLVQLNRKIISQESLLAHNSAQMVSLVKERNKGEGVILLQKLEIGRKLALSDSLTKQIQKKQTELLAQNRVLSEKESVIQTQSNWLFVAIVVILIVVFSVLYISRAYLQIQRAKKKIAEQKERLEAIVIELKKTQQQLVYSEKMASLGVLVAGVAHEINNPINFINSGIAGVEKSIEKIFLLLNELKQLGKGGSLSDIERIIELKDRLKLDNVLEIMPEVIANIKMGVNRTIEITNGLRLYARLDKEEKSLNDIHQVIDTALLLVNSKLNKRIEIVKNYGSLPMVYVYPGKLSQVFINILSNAIDSIFSCNDLEGKPTISILTQEINGKIYIEFSDTGTGIPPDIMNKIFDPFFTTKKVGSGTGLGLSISTGIIEEHQGTISVRNNLTKGAVFIVELPINKDSSWNAERGE